MARPMRIVSLVLGLVTVVLSSCSHAPPAANRQTDSTSDTKPPPEISIVYTSNRQLELESCGCSFYPLGGLDREWNQLKKWGNQVAPERALRLTGGTTFVPLHVQTDQGEAYLKKSEFLVEALNAMRFDALSPSADDVALGMQTMRALEKKATFPFVSTNLVSKSQKKTIFNPYLVINKNGLRVLILGLSDVAHQITMDKDFEVTPPIEAVRGALAKQDTAPDLIVVMTSLDRDQVNRLEEAFPQVNLFLGGPSEGEDLDVQQDRAATLRVNPQSQDRAMVRISLAPKVAKNPFVRLYNSLVAYAMDIYRDGISNKLEAAEARLKTEKDAKRIATLNSDRKAFQEALQKSEGVDEPSESAARYDYAVTKLERSLEQPTNPMTQLLDRYKKATWQQAVESAETVQSADGK